MHKDVERLLFATASIFLIVTVYIMGSERSKFQEEVHKKEDLLADISMELDTVKEEVEAKDTAIEKLTDSNTNLEKDLEEAQEETKALNEKVASIESELKEKKKEAEKLQLLSASTKKETKKSPVVTKTSTKKSTTAKPKGKTLTMQATAYTAYCKGCSGITYTGIDLRSNPNQKVIAVDPNVIPLGSKVWVEGYGEAIAGDIGSAIKGNRIDIFMPNREDALAFGRRDVTVKILN